MAWPNALRKRTIPYTYRTRNTIPALCSPSRVTIPQQVMQLLSTQFAPASCYFLVYIFTLALCSHTDSTGIMLRSVLQELFLIYHFILSGKFLCSKKFQGMMEVQGISCSNGTRRFIGAFVQYHHPCRANQFTLQNARFRQIQFNTGQCK